MFDKAIIELFAFKKTSVSTNHNVKETEAYFDAHRIKVLTNIPIKVALRNADLSGTMEKWSVELGIFHIYYMPRMLIKSQVLAGFIAEFTGATETDINNQLPVPA